MSTYNFDVILRPYGDSPNVGRIEIDTSARYGCWEYQSGIEGGGLWFDRNGEAMELIDYDGAFLLPRRVISALREYGVVVDGDFDH